MKVIFQKVSREMKRPAHDTRTRSSAHLAHYFAGGQMTDHQNRNPDILMTPQQLAEHDMIIHDQTKREERERVLGIIRGFDECCCPHEECHSGEGHDGLNCRDCVIRFIEESLRGEQR